MADSLIFVLKWRVICLKKEMQSQFSFSILQFLVRKNMDSIKLENMENSLKVPIVIFNSVRYLLYWNLYLYRSTYHQIAPKAYAIGVTPEGKHWTYWSADFRKSFRLPSRSSLYIQEVRPYFVCIQHVQLMWYWKDLGHTNLIARFTYIFCPYCVRKWKNIHNWNDKQIALDFLKVCSVEPNLFIYYVK